MTPDQNVINNLEAQIKDLEYRLERALMLKDGAVAQAEHFLQQRLRAESEREHAVAAERRRCAQIAERFNAKSICSPDLEGLVVAGEIIADHILDPAEKEATHRCRRCGAWWRLNPANPEEYPPPHLFSAETWSCVAPGLDRSWNNPCGGCCDNVAMGDQIKALTPGSDRC